MSILKDIRDFFNPPITFFLLFLGVVLLVLGLTTGVNIPQQDISLISEPSYRPYTIVLGGLCVIACFVWNAMSKKPTEFCDFPDEWKQPPLIRADNLTPGQKEILKYIREKTEKAPKSKLSETELYQVGQKSGKGESEIYYRLEQLRLLGLIAKDNFGGAGKNLYRISDSYKKALTVNSYS